MLRRSQALHRPRPRGGGTRPEPLWLFDLDNTLHDSSHAMFQVIDRAMTRAIVQLTGLDVAAADRLRIDYWQRYGATVIGLVRHHGVCADTFLDLSHDFDILPWVHSEPGVARKLARLPGRKILLTNAPYSYARRVLLALGLLPQFDALWTINAMQLQGRMRPKPSLALMRQVLARLRMPAAHIILVEDTLRNLKAAHQLGMRTVHMVHPDTPFASAAHGISACVDVRVRSLGELARTPAAWRIPGIQDPV